MTTGDNWGFEDL